MFNIILIFAKNISTFHLSLCKRIYVGCSHDVGRGFDLPLRAADHGSEPLSARIAIWRLGNPRPTNSGLAGMVLLSVEYDDKSNCGYFAAALLVRLCIEIGDF